MRLLCLLFALCLPVAYADEIILGDPLNPILETDSEILEAAPAASYDDLVVAALSLIGTPYRYGGTSPETGFDCSGFVQYVFELSRAISLPRTSDEMYREGRAVARSDLRPGDLLFYRVRNSPRVNHVVVYIGEGRFVHAPSRGNSVRVESMDASFWRRHYVGARRVLPEDDRVAGSP
jgi:cell wall-associated NlpC family hydrolase